MSVELKCKSCGAASTFDEGEVKDGAVECPKCGSTIRADGDDILSETMRIDLNE
jgi:DNA-directed RNA polymerase subunit RPC12/RpoP